MEGVPFSVGQAQTNLEIENAQLRRRVDELGQRVDEMERLLAFPGRMSATSGDVLRRELPEKIASEVESLGRASSVAFLEYLRCAADTLKSMADEAFRREQLHDAQLTSPSGATREGSPVRVAAERLIEIPDDIIALAATGIEGVLKTPRRVLGKFLQYYRTPGAPPAIDLHGSFGPIP